MAAPPVASNDRSRARWLAVAPFALLLALWIWSLFSLGGLSNGPRGRTFGGDFALNVSSAQVLERGGNPYDGAVLLQAERTSMRRQGITTNGLGASALSLTWGGYPPLYFWALEPLSGLPFRSVATIWIIAMYCCLAAGFLACLREVAPVRWRNYDWDRVTRIPPFGRDAGRGYVDGVVSA